MTHSLGYRSSRLEVFCKKGVLRNFAKFSGKHLRQSFFLQPEAYNFIKKETLAHVFSCEFCDISKNIFFYRTPPVAAYKVRKNFAYETYSEKKGLYMKSKQLPLIEKCILSIQFRSFLKFIHLKA